MDMPDSSLSAAGTGTSADVNMQASSTAGTAGAGLLASSGAPADRNSRPDSFKTSLGIRDDVSLKLNHYLISYYGGDLERYGRPVGRAADRAYISKAPLPIMRKIIDDQPETVRANYLPSDYSTRVITAVPELLKLIREILKNEKNTFADAILNGSQLDLSGELQTDANTGPVRSTCSGRWPNHETQVGCGDTQ
ncbi:hypothetical protein Pst134EB_002231 [Puccinia striiformis f. sp. tritici]|nr:hypothetical protein Pst134EB_002231 [Puccinia striiformis f. sp. tritici]